MAWLGGKEGWMRKRRGLDDGTGPVVLSMSSRIGHSIGSQTCGPVQTVLRRTVCVRISCSLASSRTAVESGRIVVCAGGCTFAQRQRTHGLRTYEYHWSADRSSTGECSLARQ